MKVSYLNDTKSPKLLKYDKTGSPSWESDYLTVQPGERVEIDLTIPDGYGVWFKHWETGIVMISTYELQDNHGKIESERETVSLKDF